MWEKQTQGSGEILASWRWGSWRLVCRTLYHGDGACWELRPDEPIQREGHVATYLATHDTEGQEPPLEWASRRLGIVDWEKVNV